MNKKYIILLILTICIPISFSQTTREDIAIAASDKAVSFMKMISDNYGDNEKDEVLFKEALKWIDVAISFDPSNFKHLKTRNDLYCKCKQADTAIKLTKNQLKNTSINKVKYHLHLMLAFIYIEHSKNFLIGENHIKESIKNIPEQYLKHKKSHLHFLADRATAYFLLSIKDTSSKTGKKQFNETIKQSLEIAGSYVEQYQTYHQIALRGCMLLNDDDSHLLIDEFLYTFPQEPEGYAFKCNRYLTEGKLVEAKQSLEKWIRYYNNHQEELKKNSYRNFYDYVTKTRDIKNFIKYLEQEIQKQNPK